MYRYRFFKDRLAFWLIVPIFLITAYPGIASPRSTPQSLDRSGTLTITGKTAETVVVLERHFVVTETTIILNESGKKIRLGDLAVPCEAEIEYRLRMDEDPLALKITVRKLLEGATTRWSASGSEG
jgi:hypothetical protein